MKELLYENGENGAGEQLRGLIEKLVSKEKAEIFKTIDGLTHRLRQSKYDVALTILLAVTREELMDLLSIRDLLLDVRIILILPDREEDNVSIGHSLHPRYLSYVDNDLRDVAAVLEKMLKSLNWLTS